MANGTNSMREPPFPGTRGKSAALVRQEFLKARDYQRKNRAAANDRLEAAGSSALGLRPWSRCSTVDGSCTITRTGRTTS
jgi:hypothetical protein